ncbi:MAG: hypothetical protein ACLT9P_02020 [Evtepia gabavorous]
MLPEGKIFINRSSDGKETVLHLRRRSVWTCHPWAVLVNRNSYSAAEFLATPAPGVRRGGGGRGADQRQGLLPGVSSTCPARRRH